MAWDAAADCGRSARLHFFPRAQVEDLGTHLPGRFHCATGGGGVRTNAPLRPRVSLLRLLTAKHSFPAHGLRCEVLNFVEKIPGPSAALPHVARASNFVRERYNAPSQLRCPAIQQVDTICKLVLRL